MTRPLRAGVPEEGRGEGGEAVLGVAELNRLARQRLEDVFGDVWVEGELGDVVRAASGHVYFTLQDGREPAMIRCVLFRGDARRAKARMIDGERVRLRGQVTLYEPRGSYQLVARLALPAGEGRLAAELAKLRAKLAKEGLFDPARKRPLPPFPRTVGVVTSVSGAAVHDIVEVARGRCPVRLVVAHCQVQGAEAPESIVRALALVQRLPELDVVIVGRGGGGAEDLAAFDDERVARAIAACRVPVVSAVGHEVDVSIADLVADVRAATPSNAAELVVPDRALLEGRLETLVRRIERALDARLDRERLRLDRLVRRLGDPRRTFGRTRATLLDLERALHAALRRRLGRERARLSALGARVARHDPRTRLGDARRRLAGLERRLGAVRATLVARRRADLGELAARMQALSPLAVLARGYAIALHGPTGRALVRAADARPGDAVRLRLHEGALDATVVAVTPRGGAPDADGGTGGAG